MVRERSRISSAQRLRSGSWWATTTCSISPVSSTTIEIAHQSASSGTASSVSRSSVCSSSSDELSSAVASDEEGKPFAQRLLGHREPRPLECERSLPPERDLERAALGRKLLVVREGEDEPADRAPLADQRDAHEPVPGLRAADQFRVALVPLRLRADEDALAGSHRLREREVPADGEAAERIDVPHVVAARRDHLEPLAVVAERRDQPTASLGRAHSLGQHRVEHLLRRVSRRERVRDLLQPVRRVERDLAVSHRALGALAGRPLAPDAPRYRTAPQR